MQKLTSYILNLLLMISLVSSFGCKSDFDKERKSTLADEIIEKSLCRCDLQEDFNSSSTYETRLRTVLTNTKFRSLSFLKENNVTICLDPELANVKTSAFRRVKKPQALYYPGFNVITICDNNQSISEGDDFLEAFSEQYKTNFNSITNIQSGYAGAEVDPFDGSLDYTYDWEDDAEQSRAIEQNPLLSNPPAHLCQN